MHTPKMRPQMGACEANKGGRPNDGEESCCTSLRCWLIVWACMRLVVSVVWTTEILMCDIAAYAHFSSFKFLAYGLYAIIAQIVEFAMLVTFIVAGIKRRANLYRAYYRYCILTLIIYIIVVILSHVLRLNDGYLIGQIYLTFELANIYFNDDFIFAVAVIVNSCLEVLLIYLIKKLINKYQCNEDDRSSETA